MLNNRVQQSLTGMEWETNLSGERLYHPIHRRVVPVLSPRSSASAIFRTGHSSTRVASLGRARTRH